MKYKSIKSESKVLEKEKNENVENLISTQENLFSLRRTSLRNEDVLKTYVRQGTLQVD